MVIFGPLFSIYSVIWSKIFGCPVFNYLAVRFQPNGPTSNYAYASAIRVFEMAAMPFPCNGILLIQGNLPRIFPISTLRPAIFPIPYFKLF